MVDKTSPHKNIKWKFPNLISVPQLLEFRLFDGPTLFSVVNSWSDCTCRGSVWYTNIWLVQLVTHCGSKWRFYICVFGKKIFIKTFVSQFFKMWIKQCDENIPSNFCVNLISATWLMALSVRYHSFVFCFSHWWLCDILMKVWGSGPDCAEKDLKP